MDKFKGKRRVFLSPSDIAMINQQMMMEKNPIEGEFKKKNKKSKMLQKRRKPRSFHGKKTKRTKR